MRSQSYLISKVHRSLFALETGAVSEILLLPELTPLEESHACIAGVFNHRGRIVPVVDLRILFSYPLEPYHIHQSVVVLAVEEKAIGLIVDQVQDVEVIGEDRIEAPILSAADASEEIGFSNGVARAQMGIVKRLNIGALLSAIFQSSGDGHFKILGGMPRHDGFERCLPEALDVFRERSRAFEQIVEGQDFSGLRGMAVISLGEEYFGIDLEVVREFTEMRAAVPVPCSASHIIGLINLRGDILTVIDIRPVLKMNTPSTVMTKVVVIETNALLVGVIADDVCDVVYLKPDDMAGVPITVRNLNHEYLKGTVFHSAKTITLLDLPKILSQGELIVNDPA